MSPTIAIAPAVILSLFTGGMLVIGQARADASAAERQVEHCREVATAKYVAGDIDSEGTYELALNDCDVQQ